MAHCIIALYRLSTFEWRDWDHSLVRDCANLSKILEQLIANFAQVKADVGLDKGILDNKDIFSISSITLNNIKVWWESKSAAETTRLDNTLAMDDMMADVPMDFLDDAWLQDVLGTGPYRFEPFAQ